MQYRLINLGLLSLVSTALARPTNDYEPDCTSSVAAAYPSPAYGQAHGLDHGHGHGHGHQQFHHKPSDVSYSSPDSKPEDEDCSSTEAASPAAPTASYDDEDEDCDEDEDSSPMTSPYHKAAPYQQPSECSPVTVTKMVTVTVTPTPYSSPEEQSPYPSKDSEETPCSSDKDSYAKPTASPYSVDPPAMVKKSLPGLKTLGNGGGKRGLAYNDASLTQCFGGHSKVTWAYNWVSAGGNDLPKGVEYVPMLWGQKNDFVSKWPKEVEAALARGSKHILCMNEPDHTEQAYMSPAAAAAFYRAHCQPYANRASVGGPAVTNGGGNMGLNWLKQFLNNCRDCNIGFLPIHWYDSAANSAYFIKHLNDAKALAGGRKIWVTEFGATGSDAEQAAFLATAMKYMDAQDWIGGYAYFMVSEGKLVNGKSKSLIGNAFAG